MKTQTLIASIILTLASSQAFAAAQTTVCKNGKDERKIELSSDTAPCEVKYYKGTDTEGKVIYDAKNDAEFCATKAKEFTERLGTLGFNCDGSETVTTAKKEEPAAGAIETKTETKIKTETKAAEPAKK